MGNKQREWENKKWKQSSELEMKLLIGLRFKLGFVPIFLFNSRSLTSFPAPRSALARNE